MKKILNGLDLTGTPLTGVPDGVNPTDAANKRQLDAAIRGLDWKASVRAATTAAITLSGTQTIDGVALNADDSVLVKNQASAATNGIYLVKAGAWVRRTDADDSAEVTSGLTVAVTEGTTKGTGTNTSNPLAWTLSTADPIVVGTTALTFVPAPSGGTAYSAGNGLALSGTTFSVTPKSNGGIVVDGTGVSVDPNLVTRKYAQDIGNGSSTSIVVTHSLGTLDVIVQLYDKTTGEQVGTDVLRTSTSQVTINFATAPASAAYRVLVQG